MNIWLVSSLTGVLISGVTLIVAFSIDSIFAHCGVTTSTLQDLAAVILLISLVSLTAWGITYLWTALL